MILIDCYIKSASQIVIQIGEEQNGMVTVRSGDNKQGSCPLQYLQEV